MEPDTQVESESARLLTILDPALLFKICSYLDATDYAKLVVVSQQCRQLVLDEEVWRIMVARTFGGDLTPGFLPSDHLWRAEYVARRIAKRRTESYMRALSQGRAGKMEPPPERLKGERFAALEGPMRAAEVQLSRLRLQEAKAQLANSAAAELLENIANASKVESVGVRQGSCTWSSLKAS